MCVRQMRPPGRGDFSFGDFSHAPSPKNLSKNGFCPQKGGSLSDGRRFCKKNFQVRERIPLSALAPARRAAAASETESSALRTNRQSTPWSTAMLAEIYLLKLEAAVRVAKEAATAASTSRFVPAALLAAKACARAAGENADHVSVGGWAQRALCRDCRRVCPAQGGCHPHVGRGGLRGKAGYLDDPDRHRLARSRRDKRCDAALADARSTLLRLLALHSSGSHTRARPN